MALSNSTNEFAPRWVPVGLCSTLALVVERPIRKIRRLTERVSATLGEKDNGSLAQMPELDRVLKVGGWICARTPNRYGFRGDKSRCACPLARSLVRFLQPDRKAKDILPWV
jgi:hypothetical protein